MRKRAPAGIFAALLVAALLVVGLGGALKVEAAVQVVLEGPATAEPLFGTVTVEASVSADEELERIDVFVDDRLRHRHLEPPKEVWIEVEVDLGTANREHRFEIVARSRSGEVGRAEASSPAFEVGEALDLNLQQVYVTVTDLRGRRVTGLTAEDFQLEDAGVDQELVTFASAEIPFTAVLLFDASSSMREGQRAAAEAGVRVFAEGMRDLDEARLMVFAHRLVAQSPFTEDPELLLQVLSAVQPGGGTALYDHIFWAARALEERQGRQVLIFLSDGADVHSALRVEQVREVLRRSPALVYWVELPVPGSNDPSALRFHSFQPPEEIRDDLGILRKLVETSGGRILTVGSPAGISDALEEILAELRDQYALGYYPTEGGEPGEWRQLELKVRGLGKKARAREGYFVPASL